MAQRASYAPISSLMSWTGTGKVQLTKKEKVGTLKEQGRGVDPKSHGKVQCRRVREHWVVMRGSETDGTESSLMVVCTGDPMLQWERRELNQSVSHNRSANI